jgi:hypothetical protein
MFLPLWLILLLSVADAEDTLPYKQVLDIKRDLGGRVTARFGFDTDLSSPPFSTPALTQIASLMSIIDDLRVSISNYDGDLARGAEVIIKSVQPLSTNQTRFGVAQFMFVFIV